MAQNNKLATQHYQSIIKALKKQNFSFTEHQDDLAITATFTGDDLPINVIIRVIPDSSAVQLVSPMSFEIPEEKRVEIALAIAFVNNKLINGGFDYDLKESTLSYRSAVNYDDNSVLTDDFFLTMLFVAAQTIDDYNEKFMMLARSLMTIEQFLNLK